MTLGLQVVDELCAHSDDKAGTLLLLANKCVIRTIQRCRFCGFLISFGSRHYALSAVAALFKHVELKLNTSYAGGSLHFKCCSNEGTMFMDSATAQALELTCSILSRRSTRSLYGYAGPQWLEHYSH